METWKKRSDRVERERVLKILHREGGVQQQRFKDLEDALAQQNYERVGELMSSLEVGLSQLLDADNQVVEVEVKPRRKVHRHV
jgi:hypothetical protein